MFPNKSSVAHCLVSATLLCAAHAAWAGVPNATCSSGIAKTAACQGGNKAGQPAGKDASCCEVKPNPAAKQDPTAEGIGKPKGWVGGAPSVKASIPPPDKTTAAATKPPPGSQNGPMDPTDGDKAAGKVAPISDVTDYPVKKKK